jgi:hypothetical protein
MIREIAHADARVKSMRSSQPTTADWLRFFNRTRLVSGHRKAVASADPFANPVQHYLSTQSSALERFGIRRLFLQTRDSRSVRYYDLAASGGHIAKPGRTPFHGNYQMAVSRSYYLTQDATNPKDGFRLQVIIHHDSADEGQIEAIRAYSNMLGNCSTALKHRCAA